MFSIMLLFANFAYLNTQSTYDKQYIGHAGELRVLSQRIAKNATEAAAGKAAAFKLLSDARNDFAQRWGYLKKGDPQTGLPAAPSALEAAGSAELAAEASCGKPATPPLSATRWM